MDIPALGLWDGIKQLFQCIVGRPAGKIHLLVNISNAVKDIQEYPLCAAHGIPVEKKEQV